MRNVFAVLKASYFAFMKRLLFLCLILTLIACNKTVKSGNETPTTVEQPTGVPLAAKKPKNIILMIGDGMGLAQITAGMYANGNKISLERFPVVGLHKPHAYDDLITDSAAGATAFSCGCKTYNGAIGVKPDTLPCRTILEMAESKGLATGLVASSSIVHATPASFIAHQKQRRMYEEIAADFMKTEVDFFVGGGKKFFDRRSIDERNLYQELQANGYQVSDFIQQELQDVNPDIHKNFAFFTADQEPLPKSQGRDYLPIATRKAIEFLDQQEEGGFFLMVEGSQIDWGGHANDANYIISEMQEFDGILEEVMDFAEKDGETLVITTADHETGGFSIVKPSRMDSLATKFTSDYHTAILIPVFAYGPGASAFAGIYENTAIFDKMKAALKLK